MWTMIRLLRNQTLERFDSFQSRIISLVSPEIFKNQIRTKFDHGFRHRDGDGRNQEIEETRRDKLYLCKSKGQHLLTNNRILDRIVSESDVRPTDTILEIGPGTGNLTVKLLEAAEKVVAVEVDKRMVEILSRRVAELGFLDKIEIIQNDALKTEFPQFDLVVANIPYNISSPLVSKLVYGHVPFRSATLLLQKEFSRRLLAEPGDSDFNRLAVNVKLVADVEFVMDVSKREFVPCPKVDSSVVIIRPKKEKPDVDLGEWLAFTRTCFGKKNRTLGATLKQKKKVNELLGLSENVDRDCGDECDKVRLFKEKIMGVLRLSAFEDKRPSKLCHEELLKLLCAFNQSGIFFNDRSEPVDVLHDDDADSC